MTDTRVLYYGFFSKGKLEGDAWEIPPDAYDNGLKALKDWSFEAENLDSIDQAYNTFISQCWFGSWGKGGKK